MPEYQQVPLGEAILPDAKGQDSNYRGLALIIVAGIFATTLPQPQVLGRQPLQNILKNELHVSREQTALFFLLCGLAWYLKPFAGILTDAFPLFGTRRRAYLLGSSILAGISWAALFLVPKTYNGLLIGSIVINVFMMIASTVVGAVLVEAGQTGGATGKLTALRQGVSSLCTLITGPIAGLLASSAFGWTAGVNAALVLSVFPIAYILVREHTISKAGSDPFRNAREQLRIIGRSRNLWFAILFIGLYYFAPGLGTVLYYRQNDELKFSQQMIGDLGIYGGAAGILAAWLYSRAIKVLSLRTMLLIGIGTAGLSTLAYLFYNDYALARIIDGQSGLFGTLAEVALIDLAARATPKGCEGLGYSLILSMRNIALFGADWLGSKLADSMHLKFTTLVTINAGTTFVVLVLLPLIPSTLLQSRDTGTPTGARPA